MNTVLILDLSYYTFYRFFATKQWYQRAHPEDVFDSHYDWSKNQLFWDKFQKLYKQNIDSMIKTLRPQQIILARDSPRSTLWRNAFYSHYKANREVTATANIKEIFQRCYAEIIPSLLLYPHTHAIRIPQCEADDVIYLSVRFFNAQEHKPTSIFIISSDHDLCQLVEPNPNVRLLDAKQDDWTHKAKPTHLENVFSKCILGDPSDYIPKSIAKVGEQTAKKMCADPSLLLYRFQQSPEEFDLFCRNKCLVDFVHIPEPFIDYFQTDIVPQLL